MTATKNSTPRQFLLAACLLLATAGAAAAQGPGVRAGLSIDPDQVFIGGHYETEALIDHLHFRPNIEAGFGDDLTLIALNFEFAYKFPARRGWHLYAGDYNDNLARSAGLDSLVTAARADKNYTLNQWCMGTMDRWPDMTNAQLIMDSTLFKYVGALAVYKCPADRHAGASGKNMPWGGAGKPSVRSMSMNCWMNPINAWAPDNAKGNTPVTNFRRLGGIRSPSDTWVTIDENPVSINDGWFVCDPTASTWVDAPASSTGTIYYPNEFWPVKLSEIGDPALSRCPGAITAG